VGAARSAAGRTTAVEALDRNEVVVVGRLVSAPAVRELPSGDSLASFRVVVRRPESSRPRPGSPRVDALECAAFRGDVRKAVRTWVEGDVVEVTGALRRRFWRTGGAPSSVWEIEVAKARRLVRA
jgi:single-strand DNA-binding protein